MDIPNLDTDLVQNTYSIHGDADLVCPTRSQRKTSASDLRSTGNAQQYDQFTPYYFT